MTDWLGKTVRERATGRVGVVTADLPAPEYDDDVLAVYYGPDAWHTHTPNAYAKAELFEVVEDDCVAGR